ncbi:hypothetical protein SAY86_031301 [Trapa natans]|uniref:RRM domain-containing protein n=1 Tax=Trapa natans TaxID=22666 RepID=A0AAN7LLP6_TRANT|nr:hypothetical protein SAY86_031301 [Trapa natans]
MKKWRRSSISHLVEELERQVEGASNHNKPIATTEDEMNIDSASGTEIGTKAVSRWFWKKKKIPIQKEESYNVRSGAEPSGMNYPVQKNTLYVGGLAEEVNEAILHATFIPFGDIKDVKTPLDLATQKHRSFGFVTFLEREDAAAAMDNMDGAELYGRVLTVNYALPG